MENNSIYKNKYGFKTSYKGVPWTKVEKWKKIFETFLFRKTGSNLPHESTLKHKL